MVSRTLKHEAKSALAETSRGGLPYLAMYGFNDTRRAPGDSVNTCTRQPDEHWVRRSLIEAYAPVLQEKLPAEWLAMIEAAPHWR